MSTRENVLKKYGDASAGGKSSKLKRKRKPHSASSSALQIIDEDIDRVTSKRNVDEAWRRDMGSDDDAPIVVESSENLESIAPKGVWETVSHVSESLLRRDQNTSFRVGVNRQSKHSKKCLHDDKHNPNTTDDISPPRRKRRDVSEISLPGQRSVGDREILDPEIVQPTFDSKQISKGDEHSSVLSCENINQIFPNKPVTWRRSDKNPETSPVRTRHDSADESPPRRQRHDAPDKSLPRSRRHDSPDESPPRRRRHDSPDESPPRRRRHDSPNESPPRRKRHDSPDESLPRRRRDSPDESPSQRRWHESPEIVPDISIRKDLNDLHGNQHIDARVTTKQVIQSNEKSSVGHVAGLHRREDFIKIEQEIRDGHVMSASLMKDSGQHAETVFRDSEGRKLNVADEVMRQQTRATQAKKEKAEAEYEWGTGKVQKEDEKSKLKELENIKLQPFARTVDQIDEELKSAIHADDPMAKYMMKKVAKKVEKEGTNAGKPAYKGPMPKPNRFGILPGYRWDGIDRGNGWEQKLVEYSSKNEHRRDTAYSYSVSDL